MIEPPPHILPVAEGEISDAFRWYEDKAEGSGSEFMRALDASLASIQHNPEQYATVYKQVRRAPLRRFPYGVFYFVANDSIVVVACFHGSRDPKAIKFEKRRQSSMLCRLL